MYRANPSYGHTHFRQSEKCFLDAILTYIGNTNNANLFVNHATFRRCTCSDLNIYSVALYKKDLAMYVTPIIKNKYIMLKSMVSSGMDWWPSKMCNHTLTWN